MFRNHFLRNNYFTSILPLLEVVSRQRSKSFLRLSPDRDNGVKAVTFKLYFHLGEEINGRSK